MPIGNCRLCLKTKELSDSHIIPNATFRYIFKRNKGRGITFADNKNSYVEHTSESWSEYLLCADCEDYLNKNYEQYSISLLRGSLKSIIISKHKNGISFNNIDSKRLYLFFTSIIWRAATSSLEVYSKISFPDRLDNEIRKHLFENKKLRSCMLGIKLSRLIDKSPDGFSAKVLKEFIISPFYRDLGRGFAFCFLIEGFFVEIFIPSMSLRERSSHGVIHPNKKILFSPFLNIFDVPELVKVLTSGQRKHHTEGKTRI